MASRRKGRILAFQALYFWEFGKVPIEELTSFAWIEEGKLERFGEEMAAFSSALIAGTIENIEEIDNVIKGHLHNWDITRLNRVDLAVIRMSVYSLLYQKDIHPSVVIDEAIGICKEFGTEDSFRFVNGVLDNIRKTYEKKADE